MSASAKGFHSIMAHKSAASYYKYDSVVCLPKFNKIKPLYFFDNSE